MANNFFNTMFILRILLGFLFILSSSQKLIGPYQNFLYVIQSYELPLAPFLEEVIARVLPWGELILGIFLTLGLWTKQSLQAASILFILFIGVVAQALIRALPIGECGCFGEQLSVAPPVMLGLDVGFFLITLILLRRIEGARRVSLDRVFEKNGE